MERPMLSGVAAQLIPVGEAILKGRCELSNIFALEGARVGGGSQESQEILHWLFAPDLVIIYREHLSCFLRVMPFLCFVQISVIEYSKFLYRIR
jgi:hypothetical protein